MEAIVIQLFQLVLFVASREEYIVKTKTPLSTFIIIKEMKRSIAPF